jgi:hypothetical protein
MTMQHCPDQASVQLDESEPDDLDARDFKRPQDFAASQDMAEQQLQTIGILPTYDRHLSPVDRQIDDEKRYLRGPVSIKIWSSPWQKRN